MPTDPGRMDKSLRIDEVEQRVGDGAVGYEIMWGRSRTGEYVWGAL